MTPQTETFLDFLRRPKRYAFSWRNVAELVSVLALLAYLVPFGYVAVWVLQGLVW
jgi:hypothetical protein